MLFKLNYIWFKRQFLHRPRFLQLSFVWLPSFTFNSLNITAIHHSLFTFAASPLSCPDNFQAGLWCWSPEEAPLGWPINTPSPSPFSSSATEARKQTTPHPSPTKPCDTVPMKKALVEIYWRILGTCLLFWTWKNMTGAIHLPRMVEEKVERAWVPDSIIIAAASELLIVWEK